MPLIVPADPPGFACAAPAHPDGATVRCAGTRYALAGIRVLPPAEPCRRYTDCPIDSGSASRDHLAEITRGRAVRCHSVARTRGKASVRCTAAGRDLSCTMLADGAATPAGPALACPPAPVKPTVPVPVARAAAPWLWIGGALYLLAVNLLSFFAFASDAQRRRDGSAALAPPQLLLLAAAGGGIGAIIAQARAGAWRHDQPFASQFAIITGLQIGMVVGLVALAYWS